MIDIEEFKDIGVESMEWTFTKRPTKLWVDMDYGRAVIDTKEQAGTTGTWYLEEEVKLMAEAPRLLAEVKRLREVIEILDARYDSLIIDLLQASLGDLDIEEVYEKHLMGVNDE